MTTRTQSRRPSPFTPRTLATPVAGWILIVLGGVNVAFALLSAVSDLVQLTGGALGALLAAGALTVVLGVLVIRGSRLALATALLIFGTLLFLEIGRLGQPTPADLAGGPARIVVLVVVVLTLTAAQVRDRRRRRP